MNEEVKNIVNHYTDLIDLVYQNDEDIERTRLLVNDAVEQALKLRIVSCSTINENKPKPLAWLKECKLGISEGETYKETNITIRQCASFISEYVKEYYS